MSACPRCGEENAERARFCSACGAALQARTSGEARKTVTVIFSDVTNSTRIGELLDPESHRRLMGRWFAAMREPLERHGGTIEKFIGDAVMAVFGVPVLHEDDALRAVRAAAEMREALAGLNEELQRDWQIEIATRTGVNTGEVVAGDPRTGETLVTGDAVVVAKRLEESAAPGEIRLGEGTYRLVKESVVAEPVGPVSAKGKPAIAAWRLLATMPRSESTPLRLDSPLVGRGNELAALRDAFDRVGAERSCRLFSILGPAGIGKSRLTHELIAALPEGTAVLRGRCLPYGEGITFWPLVEVVKQAAGLTERDSPDEATRKIGRLLNGDDSALVSERLAAAVGRGEVASARPEETFWAVRRLLESLARERPLVVLFDDIQWAEPMFLDLVEYVAGWSTGAPILICCLARPELLELRPSWGLPRSNAAMTLLEPLPEPETDELIGNLLGRLPLAAETRARIAEAAAGNPLFVEELIRMLLDEGVLQRDTNGWRASGNLAELAVPPTIHALLAARLDRLDPEERAVIQRAAVAGEVFWWGAVAELSPRTDRTGVGAHLQSLVRKELIRQERSAFAAEDAFRFEHILIRDAAYAALPKEARATLHEQLAGWLEDKTAERAAEYEEIVGYHLEQAFRYRLEIGRRDESAAALAGRAGGRLAAAGQRALTRGDAPAATRLLERAAALQEDDERVETLLALGRASWDVGDLEEAERVFVDAADSALAIGAEGVAALARVEAAFLRAHRAPLARSADIIEAARAAIEVFEAKRDDAALAKAWTRLADAHFFRGDCAEMEACLEEALAHAESSDAYGELPHILSGLGTAALYGPRPVREAAQRCEELLERARGNLATQADLEAKLALLEAMRGAFTRARELLADVERTFRELGWRFALAGHRGFTGSVELLAGDPAAAARELSRGVEELEAMGERGVLSTLAGDLGEALYQQERFEEAERAAVLSEEAAVEDDAISQLLWRGVRAKILARRGDHERAEELAREGVAIAEETDFPEYRARAVAALAEVVRLLGRHEEAERLLEGVVALHEAKGNTVLAARARNRLDAASPTL